jgi:hypothetical protein
MALKTPQAATGGASNAEAWFKKISTVTLK